jgi:hypothetical protein
MEEKKTDHTHGRTGGPETPTAFNRRDVSHNTHPRGNQEIDRRDLDRSVELFSRVLGN